MAKLAIRVNSTGISHAPERARHMMEGSVDLSPSPREIADAIAHFRAQYARRSNGFGLGSIPEQWDEKKAAGQGDLRYLMDKLGERLSFERAGVRLYEALLSKLEAYGTYGGGPEREDLEHIRDEERQHLYVLIGAVSELGGDPTAVTPAADLQGTASRGIVDVVVDPRTTLAQSLEAMMAAELTDYAGWERLIELVKQHGFDDLAEQFSAAERAEAEHLARVKTWLVAADLAAL